MLKIIKDGHAFDLPIDIKVNLVIENPLFLTERSPAVYSITSTLPPTRRNMEMLEYPRFNRTTLKLEFTGVKCFFGPISFFDGVLVVTDISELGIDYHFRGIQFPEDFKKSSNEIEFEERDFGDNAEFPGSFQPDFEDANDYGYKYSAYTQSLADDLGQEILAPIRVADEEWPTLKNQANEDVSYPVVEGIEAADKLYLNFYNAFRKDFLIGSIFSGIPIDPENHSPCFPSIRVGTFINKVFGDLLESNPFAVGEFDRLVLVNTYHPAYQYPNTRASFFGILLDQYAFPAIGDDRFSLNPGSFNGNTPANELIRDLQNLFCLRFYTIAGKFVCEFNKDVLNSNEVLDWSRKVIGEINYIKEPPQSYGYGYESGTSSAPGYSDSVENIADLRQVNLPTKDLLVEDTGEVYDILEIEKIKGDEPDRFRYEPKNPFRKKDGDFSVIPGIEPMKMNVGEYWQYDNDEGEYITLRKWYTPVFEKDRFTLPGKPHIMIFHGKQRTMENNSDRYPYMSYHNYNSSGLRLGDLSLQWEGEDGLLVNFHQEFKAWIERDKLSIKSLFALDALDIKNIDLRKKRHVKGRNFLIRKVEVTIEYNKIQPARCELVEDPV